ncbi:MAG: alpha-mannosidase [Cellulosilyticaceae bacterium]
MKKAHIISHTHWDREWYLPYEKHHMLLVEFMDSLIDTLEKDRDYKSFHLDGQTIILEDYLQVRPEKRERLTSLIQEKRIIIGPWYILQDEFLTSSEANVRNLQIGHKDAKAYGEVCKVGYFPDSFGNMGQAPQILKEAGIDTAVFGRGVKPTGFNNQVSDGDKFESPYSEMYWESHDGSKVLGILFANWYSNGNEIPVETEAAKVFWDARLENAGAYASTEHMLFMNGCDHQPVQTDLAAAIKEASSLYKEVEFIHSNFEDYIKEIKENAPNNLKVIQGELRSQQTSGWYTLANTASARVYIKQTNSYCQMLLEKIAEPLATMAYDQGKDYPHHMFEYGWKLLMQNHPHDSICGCSVDAVHREMVSRFEKAEAVANHIIDESMNYMVDNINTNGLTNQEEGAIPIVVVNTTGNLKSDVVQTEIKLAKKYFSEGPLRAGINEVKNHQIGHYKLVDEKGNSMPCTIKPQGNKFDYDLPKDKFRQPYTYQSIDVTFGVNQMEPFSIKVFTLVPVAAQVAVEESLLIDEYTMENAYIRASVKEDGSLDIVHKSSGHTFTELGIYEDHGDIGNEYIYMMPVGEKAITTKGVKAKIRVVEDAPYRAIIEVVHEMLIPASADERLADEIKELIEFRDRKSQRVDELVPFIITTHYTLEKYAKGIKVKASFDNQALDHRLRMLFETKLESKHHYADSIFEVAKRETEPSKYWENPCNAQHQQKFVNIHNEQIGLTVANKGLNEYEVIRDGKQTIAITLHRGVRELGDWGVFMTPEAQCLGKGQVELEIIPHGEGSELYESYQEAYQFAVPLMAREAKKQEGGIPLGYQLMNVTGLEAMYSSLKVNETSGDIIGRWYSVSEKEVSLAIDTNYKVYQSNLLEERVEKIDDTIITLRGAQIVSLGFEK